MSCVTLARRARLPSASAARSSSPWRRFISSSMVSSRMGRGWMGWVKPVYSPSSSGGRQKNCTPARKPSARLTARSSKSGSVTGCKSFSFISWANRGEKPSRIARLTAAVSRSSSSCGASGAAFSACTAASSSSAAAEKTTRQSPGSAMPKCSSFIFFSPSQRTMPAISTSSTMPSTTYSTSAPRTDLSPSTYISAGSSGL